MLDSYVFLAIPAWRWGPGWLLPVHFGFTLDLVDPSATAEAPPRWKA